MNGSPQNKRPKGWLSRHHKHGRRSWRQLRLAFLRWRGLIMSKPHTALAYRFCVALLGAFVVLIGLALVPLPGPGWLTVIIGLFIISTEFHWARHVLHFVRTNVEKWSHWVVAQPVWVRWTMGGVTAVFIAVLVWAAISIFGLPHWVPQLEVLRRLELQ